MALSAQLEEPTRRALTRALPTRRSCSTSGLTPDPYLAAALLGAWQHYSQHNMPTFP